MARVQTCPSTWFRSATRKSGAKPWRPGLRRPGLPFVSSMQSMGAAAYLIRRSAAARFCALPVLDQEIDSAFGDFRLSLRVLELDPYAVVQDRETPTLVSFQQYPPGFRRGLNFWERLALPWRKRG